MIKSYPKASIALIFLLFTIVYVPVIYSQSRSVFDASYFNSSEGLQPPIRPGKGFDISDVYKQTKYCFTKESSHPDVMKAQQAGFKTSITIHYTKDEQEYNLLKKNGSSGKVSFLNLFSLGGAKLSEYTSQSNKEEERLVFIAKVDFGVFEFEDDPVLTPEAKTLVDQGKYNEFLQFYGTHYISGVRKESSIWVTITKSHKSSGSSSNDYESNEAGFNVPTRAAGSFEVSNTAEVSKFFNSEGYFVSIEIIGPSIDKAGLESSIQTTLKSSRDKFSGVRQIISKALEQLSDPSMSLITQYYYSPFTLHGVNNIVWNAKKENNLVKINENVLTVYACKNKIDHITGPTGLINVKADYDNEIVDFSKKDFYRSEIEKTYSNILPKVKIYKAALDTTVSFLEKQYKKSIEISYDPDTKPLNITSIENKIKDLIFKAESEMLKLEMVKRKAWEEALNDLSIPECEKEQIGYLTIVNISTNPYQIYYNNNFITTVSGKSEYQVKLNIGNHQLRAEQKSGYMMYPTINNRPVTIQKACDSVTIKIGFED